MDTGAILAAVATAEPPEEPPVESEWSCGLRNICSEYHDVRKAYLCGPVRACEGGVGVGDM